MSWLIDLEKILRVLSRNGEKVVLALPGQEPVVLLPLSQYEKLLAPVSQLSSRAPVTSPQLNSASSRPRGRPPKSEINQPNMGNQRDNRSYVSPTGVVEAVDPLQGGLADDDQYYPEPLD